ncbi:MAG: M15 family metallopeptidase [Bacteroides sp.]|nr:M15 family metallopeptidase [Bacteroides sp.]
MITIASDNDLKAESLSKRLEDAGFVAVNKVDTTIMVRLMYAGTDNFTGVQLYEGVSDAYLHPDAADALIRASKALHDFFPSYNLLVKDAARPMSVQRKMFRAVLGTPKANYVANPAKGGGLHNYGLAVDITIVDENGRELPMGTEVDHLGKEANIDLEVQMVREGVISETERQNRLLLRKIMTEAGFKPLRTEWWHFNLVDKSLARTAYRLLDF